MLTRLLQPTDFAALAIYLQKLFPQQIPSTAQTLQEEEAQAAQERVTGLVESTGWRARYNWYGSHQHPNHQLESAVGLCPRTNVDYV